MQTHIDRSIDHVVESFHEELEKDKVRQAGFFDNLLFQHRVSVSITGDYKITLDESTTRIDNVTSLVEGILVGSHPHHEGPPTVPLVFGRLVDPNGEQQVPVP